MNAPIAYPVRLDIDYPDRDLNRVTSGFRAVLSLPVLAGAGQWVFLAVLSYGLTAWLCGGTHAP